MFWLLWAKWDAIKWIRYHKYWGRALPKLWRKKTLHTNRPLSHWWMMAGVLESFPSWFRKMCVINFFVLKFSLAITPLCEMWTFFCCTVCYSSFILYFALSYLCVQLPGGFRPCFFFFLSKECLSWFCFFNFHHEAWVGTKPPGLFLFIFGKLAFLLPNFHPPFFLSLFQMASSSHGGRTAMVSWAWAKNAPPKPVHSVSSL